MKAAIYIRVSTDRQADEGFSLEAQHDLLMEVLERKGMELYRVYSDPGISGKTMKKRPGIQQMITDMKSGRFEAILVHKIDRLSRNLGDLYDFIGTINKLNTRLVIASFGSDEIDTLSPMGKAFLYFQGIFAEIYSDNLREETLKGLEKKMRKGGLHMSRAPLGYNIEYDEEGNRRLVINEVEAKLIRDVYKKYLEGKGVVWIAKHMNSYSRGKEGGVWDSKYVKDVLKNRTYLGQRHFKPDQWEEDRRIITEGAHEAIITQEEYNKVQKMMSRKKEGYMSRTSYDYPYGGIVKCGDCGATYIGTSTSQKLKDGTKKHYRAYRCRNHYTNGTCNAPSIQETKLNEIVFEKVMITSNKIQEKKDNPKARSDKRMLAKEVETSNRRRKNWMMALGDGKLSPDDYSSLIDEEEIRMKEIYSQFNDEDLYVNEYAIEQIKELMVNIKDNWDLLEPDTQKEFIQSMFRKIEIKKESDNWGIVDLLPV